MGAPATAYARLEEEHWEVARAAVKLAETVERYLTTYDGRGDAGEVAVLDRVRMREALVKFRDAASRVA